MRRPTWVMWYALMASRPSMKQTRHLLTVPITLAALLTTGCASELDRANDTAYEAGRSAGKVLSLPAKAVQGATDGANESEEENKNPYNR